MLRSSLSSVFLITMIGAAFAADQAPPRYAHRDYSYRAAGLPVGLPRPHYRYKTTITYEAPYAAVEAIKGHLAFYADRVEITEQR